MSKAQANWSSPGGDSNRCARALARPTTRTGIPREALPAFRAQSLAEVRGQAHEKAKGAVPWQCQSESGPPSVAVERAILATVSSFHVSLFVSRGD